MARYRKPLALLVFLAGLVLLWQFLGGTEYLSLAYLKGHQAALRGFIAAHYAEAVLVYILLLISTALIIPGAIILTMAGGALFGVVPAMIFVNIGTVVGGMITFMVTRYVVGEALQARYRSHLALFNREMHWHGASYLITLRIVPILPAFVINCLAGMTRLPLLTFLWTTSVGVLPGSLVYSYAGRKLAQVGHPAEILTWPVLTALGLLALFSLLPVFMRHGRHFLGKRKGKAP